MIRFLLCLSLIHTVFSVCPTGMYELKSGGCIHLATKNRNFENADSYCTGMGGWLTKLSSDCTHEVLSAMASVEFVDEPRTRSYIGVKLSKDTDKYVNFDGSEPDHNITVIGDKECVSLNTFTKQLETVDCDEKLPFFCTIMASGGTLFFRDNTEYFCAVSKELGCQRREIRPTTTSTVSSTIVDDTTPGVTSSPTTPITEENTEESTVTSSPATAISEVLPTNHTTWATTAVTSPPTLPPGEQNTTGTSSHGGCPEGWKFSIETKNCYFTYRGGNRSVTFARADSFCKKMRSNMVSIENDVEFKYLQSLMPQTDNCELIDGTWIGLCRKGGKDVWNDGSNNEITPSSCRDEDVKSPIDHEGHCAVALIRAFCCCDVLGTVYKARAKNTQDVCCDLVVCVMREGVKLVFQMPSSFGNNCHCTRDQLAYQDQNLFVKNFVCKKKSTMQ